MATLTTKSNTPEKPWEKFIPCKYTTEEWVIQFFPDKHHFFIASNRTHVIPCKWKTYYTARGAWIAGLFLTGNPGTGKTSLIETILKIIGNPEFRYFKEFGAPTISNIAATDIASLYPEKIEWHARHHVSHVDDVGKETGGAQWMNKHMTARELAASSHYGCPRGIFITFFTSNLSYDQVEARYGKHIIDRMNSFLDVVNLDGESKRPQ